MATRARPTHRKACSRCRKRKIRCDAGLPSCQPCIRASAQCMGYDADMNDVPRSLVTHLEEEAAALELELRAYNAVATGGDDGGSKENLPATSLTRRQLALDRAITCAVMATDAAIPLNSNDALVQSTVRLTLQLHASRLPLPFTYQQSRHHNGEGRPRRAMSVQNIPRAAAELMLKNYTEIHLPQYPCISEDELTAAFLRCIDDELTASAFDMFVVSMAMAISANTLMWKHEENALATSAGFWAMAKEQIEQPEMLQDEVQHLQYSLLMAHYGFTNPAVVDVWYCIGDAVRLCLQLGYHQNAFAIESDVSAAEMDSRRRLFWTTCGMEWAICSYTRTPPTLARDSITSQFPSSLPDHTIQQGLTVGSDKKASAWHMLQFRQLEIEVLQVLFFYPKTDGGTPSNDSTWSFEAWSTEIMQKLEDWHAKSLVFAAEEKLQFRDIQYNYLRGRIHRPTPRVPQPSRASRIICLESAMALAKDYTQQQTHGRLYYPWHGGHILFEASIYLLDTAWTCLDWLVELDSFCDVIKCIRDYPCTLRKMNKFWPALELCAAALENLSEPVLEHLENILEQGSRGITNNNNSSDQGGLEVGDDSVSMRIAEFLFPIAEIGTDILGREQATNGDDYSQFNLEVITEEGMEGDDLMDFFSGEEMLTFFLHQDLPSPLDRLKG